MRPFGVYLHIPFCARRCDYCAFATWTDRHHLSDRYVAGLITEIRRAVDRGDLVDVTSIFVGGGTPSMLPAADLGRVLDAVPAVVGAEVTVECNPDTITHDLLATYQQHGVNRISLGVQSMVPHVLAALGRTHDPDNVRRSVELLRDLGYPTFNLDLIYGGAGETLADWEVTLRATAELDPPHVSAYALTIEAGTPLALDTARHPDDDDQADKYALADDVLGEGGRTWYEISNWARPGHECRHNVLYWEQGDYLGFGCAAHSHRAGRRFWNVRTPERYLHLVEGGDSAEGGAEELDLEEQRLEALTLAVRMRGGVPVEALGPLDDLAELVDVRDGRAVLTRAGRLLTNEVSLRLR